MARAGFWLWTILAWALAGGSLPAADRPNIVLVMTDDQGYGDLACHGNPHVRTPALDRLHAESLRLTDFHVDPTCSPTRSALLTGRYSCRTGVWHTIMGRSLLRRDEVTLPQLLAAAGYRTGIFGKWHLGDNTPYRPQERGFHTSLVHRGGGIGQTPDHWGNDYFDDVLIKNGQPYQASGYCTSVFFDAALQFISDHRQGPFFVYLPTNVPHAPYNVPQEYSRPYRELGLPAQVANFYGMITHFDENLARLGEKLRALDLERNTVLIFMTDNGSAMGHYSAGMRAKKGSWYDGGHRVPCFIRWPARWRQRDVPQLAAHVDIVPTLLEICGIPPPQGLQLDGTSLVPLLDGRGQWPERTLFVQSHRIDHPQPWRQSAVLTQRWRLVNGSELYDIVADPAQQQDIAPQHADVVATLRAQYEKWYADVSRRFDEYCEIVLGADAENPLRLCCHDWHGPNAPSSQTTIDEMPQINGFWAVEIAQGGRYRFTLRHKPPEANFALQAVSARVRVGDQEATAAVPSGATHLTLELELAAGKTRLQTYLTDAQGNQRGAFYVDVERKP
jgi:arylsulfatase A-like enzyme